jgi:hypothetical protein
VHQTLDGGNGGDGGGGGGGGVWAKVADFGIAKARGQTIVTTLGGGGGRARADADVLGFRV